MLTHQLPLFKVKKSKFHISSFCGLPLLNHIAHWLGIPQQADHLLKLKERQRGYSVSQLLMSLVMLLTGGGERLDDIRMLKHDPVIRALSNLKTIPDATTLGRFLRRFRKPQLSALAQLSTSLATRIQQYCSPNQTTLDVDSSLILADKQDAQTTYIGLPGYNPMFAFLAETKTILLTDFRPGNASPGADALPFLKRCLKALPKTTTHISLRSDSAWYQAQITDYCQQHDILFSITADKDQSVKELITSLPENAWQPFEDQQIAQTVHSMGNSHYAFRLILLRRLKDQQDLFDRYVYGAIITNREDDPATIVHWHRQRADCENVIKENKHGFALAHLPCGSFEANAAFSYIVVLAYNIVQAMKYLLLPKSWKNLTIKKLRFRLLHLGGILVRHAREFIIKLPRDYPYSQLYESLTYRVRGPCPI